MKSTLRLVVHLIAKQAGSFVIDHAGGGEDDTVLRSGLLFGKISASDVPFDKSRLTIRRKTEAAAAGRAHANDVTGFQRNILILGRCGGT
jgi:hypothetical protein